MIMWQGLNISNIKYHLPSTELNGYKIYYE